jgi:hypothetical protein
VNFVSKGTHSLAILTRKKKKKKKKLAGNPNYLGRHGVREIADFFNKEMSVARIFEDIRDTSRLWAALAALVDDHSPE